MIRQLLLVLLLLFVLGMDTGSPPLELPEAPAAEGAPLDHEAMIQRAADRTEEAMQFQVRTEKVAKDVLQVKDDLGAVKAVLRDMRLADQGYAPPNWEQPSMDVYEADPTRPSHLPLESIADAVENDVCRAAVYAAYLRWSQPPVVVTELPEPLESLQEDSGTGSTGGTTTGGMAEER